MESAENQSQPIPEQESASTPQPLSKNETIALLNDSIDRLEATIKRISADSTKIPPSESINTLTNTTQELEKAVTVDSSASDSSPTQEETTPSLQQSTKPTPAPKKAKSSSPESQAPSTATTPVKTQKKKNLGLIIFGFVAIAILALGGLWLWQPPALVSLLSQFQSAPTAIATDLDLPSETSLNPEADSVVDTPNLPSNLDSTPDFPESIKPVAEPIEDVVETLIPPELISPGKVKNLKMVTIKPKLNFSPEQNLVAALETKIAELVQAYPSDVIQDIQINLPQSSLLVEVTDNWYQLETEKQDSLGNNILQNSRTFSFNKLELKDPLGTLVARNPIIGDNIIIVKNTK